MEVRNLLRDYLCTWKMAGLDQYLLMGRALVVFRLEGCFCALPGEAVSEVLPQAELYLPPALPPILAGFLNLDGKAVPVVRLARLLFPGREQDVRPGLYTHLILLRSKWRAFILQVEKALEVKYFSDEALLPMAPGLSLQDCVEAQAEEAGEKIYVLSADRLLLGEERDRIAELQTMEQERLRLLGTPPG